MRAWFEFSVRVGFVFLIACYLIKHVDIWVGLFLMLALFSHSVPFFILSGGEYLQSRESYLALNSVLIGCVSYSILIKTKININTLLNMMCIVCVIHVITLVVQKLGLDPYSMFGIKSNISPTALMANRNETSAFFAICFPAFFRKKWCYLSPIAMAGIFLVGCLNGLLAMLVSVFVWLLIISDKKKNVLLVAALSVSAGSCVILYDIWFSGISSFSDRLYIWEKSLSLSFKNQPILGWGLGNWENVNEIIAKAGGYKNKMMWSRVHNTFIHAYIEMGVVFIILIIGYFFSILKKVSKKSIISISALSAIFICCNTNSLFRMNAINGAFVILWLAILNIQQRKEVSWLQ